MPGEMYKKGRVLSDEHELPSFCCVEHLAFFDAKFAYDLKKNERLRTVFEKMTASESDPAVEDLDEISLLYVERGLMNRAHMACAQKSSLQNCYHDIRSKKIRERVRAIVDEDLNYVLHLVQRFDTRVMNFMKRKISEHLDMDPTACHLESENGVSSEDGEMADSEDDEGGHRAGHAIMGNHKPDVIPVDE